MAKGLFTQGMCVLLRHPISTETLEAQLKSFELVGRHEAMDDDDAPETLVLNFRPEVGGHLLVTPSSQKWPDEMGDPEKTPERFVAWSLGQFGPLAFPGCLQRAAEQSWGWEEGADEIKGHVSHVRFLISYVLGIEEVEDEPPDDIPLVPDDYDPIAEMKFLTRAVSAVLEHPDAICYFNPGGEVLRNESGLRQGLNYAWSHDLPPLDMWTNVRLFRAADQWSLMDTVGNGQFDIPDFEAVYDVDNFEPGDVERFLRHVSLYMLQGEAEVDDGDVTDGPGDTSWIAMRCEEALSDPPRPTIRWIPDDGSEPPEELLDRGDEHEDEEDEDEGDDGEDAEFL